MRLYLSTLHLALALLGAVATTWAAPTFSTRQAECHDYVLIEARGTGEPQGPSNGFLNMINRTLSTVPNGAHYVVVYPAAPDATQLTTLLGSEDIQTYIDEGVEACPRQMYALLGYSQGATVVNEATRIFANRTSTQARQIKAVLLIGNPYHLPNKRGNIDENGGRQTANATGVLVGTLDATIPDYYYSAGKVRDICHTTDLVCTGISVESLFSPAHLSYGFTQSVQDLGVAFLTRKLSR